MFRALALIFALLTLPALAASQLDSARTQATQARAAVGAVRSEQMARRGELNAVSARIANLKASSAGKLLPGGELDGALKKSQELSDQLTSLAQTLTSREGELESANLSLLTELSSELSRLRAEFDRLTDKGARLNTIKRLREARAEREQVRAQLPAARVPAILAVKPSDDPEDLLEQADLMKDREDQVRKEIKVLEQRIAERKDERDLDRKVNQFLSDESFFDDGDRRLRIRRETTIPANSNETTAAPAAGFAADPGAANKKPIITEQVGTGFDRKKDIFQNGVGGSLSMGAAAPAADNTRNTDSNPAPQNAAPPNDPAGGSDSATSITRVSQGKDARPIVVPIKRVAGGEDEDTDDLENQRVRLKSLADELKSRAKQLQKKAAELR